MEVQGKMQEMSRGMRQVSVRMQMNEREQRKCKLTLQDLSSLPPTTPMYRAAGKCLSFVDFSPALQAERMDEYLTLY